MALQCFRAEPKAKQQWVEVASWRFWLCQGYGFSPCPPQAVPGGAECDTLLIAVSISEQSARKDQRPQYIA